MKIDNTMPENPKVLEAGPQAAWLYVCALAYCDRNLTDGFVPETQIGRLADVHKPRKLAAKLEQVGLWRRVNGGYEIHDYLDHQRSKAQVEAEKQGSAERVKRWRKRQRNAVTPPLQKRPRNTSTEDKRTEEEKTTTKDLRGSASGDAGSSPTAAERDRDPEYVRLANLLADLIAENRDGRRPKDVDVGKWPRHLRLMREQDGLSLERIEGAIKWSQQDPFWSGVILSARNLREHYDKLEAQARQRKGLSATHRGNLAVLDMLDRQSDDQGVAA